MFLVADHLTSQNHEGDYPSSRMRSINLSPLCQGWDATVQLSVRFAASTVALATCRDRDTEPSRAMKFTSWSVSPVGGLTCSLTVPDSPVPGSHAIRSRVAEAPFDVREHCGLEHPIGAVGLHRRANSDGVEEGLVHRAGGGRDGHFSAPNGVRNEATRNIFRPLISVGYFVQSGWQWTTRSVFEAVPRRVIIVIDNYGLEIGCIFAA